MTKFQMTSSQVRKARPTIKSLQWRLSTDVPRHQYKQLLAPIATDGVCAKMMWSTKAKRMTQVVSVQIHSETNNSHKWIILDCTIMTSRLLAINYLIVVFSPTEKTKQNKKKKLH